MKAMYNRESKNVWLVHDDDQTEQLGTAETALQAYDMIGLAGFMRVTDWRLVCDGSQLREVEIRPLGNLI